MSKPQLPIRVLATKLCGNVIEVEWFRKIKFTERLRILFGANIKVGVAIATQHRSGKYKPVVMAATSWHESSTGLLEENLKRAVKELSENQYADY